MEKLFITGQMRSGTTFLANFLNSQENMMVYSDFLRSLFLEGQKLKIDKINSELSDQHKNILLSNLKAEAMSFNVEGFNTLKKDQFRTWNDLVTLGLKLVNQNDAEKNAKVIGVKKTAESYYIPELLNNDYKVIYIFRDPRDVFLSAKNRFSNYSLNRSMNAWAEDINFIMSFKGHKNLLLLKYEDLIANKN